MKALIAQVNLKVGDLSGNRVKLLEAARAAAAVKAQLLVSPELSICGYVPEDLLLRRAFVEACRAQTVALANEAPHEVALVVGLPWQDTPEGPLYNAAAVLRGGRIEAVYRKQELPNYAVFDEKRYFSPGCEACVVTVGQTRIGILICEDAWLPRAAQQARAAGAELLVVINGSPYDTDHFAAREAACRARVRETALPLLYCNLVGGQDELVFDGQSFVMDDRGELTQRLPGFAEVLALVEFHRVQGRVEPQPVRFNAPQATVADVYSALVLAVRDYVGKNGFPGVLLGLSGGIDSALVLAIAVDALGRDRVRAVMMPSKFNASMSLEDARWMAAEHGVRYDEIPIEPIYEAFASALAAQFAGLAPDATEENLQSRIRGTLLMALSNKTGWLVLTTGNKSEMTTGYATLYGDMAGGFGVLKDVRKELVYELARWRNSLGRVIPERVLTRAPSAELRHGQTDQDSLPPYPVLDEIMALYMEQNLSVAEIKARGLPAEAVDQVVRLLRINEYKRRQAPVGPRVTPRAFGRDWRYPITNGWRE
ncbi:MAG: NAD+ synthase [Casimicrobiaceae bacterium]|nr:NAD+ synthase [Casimicrobiaceae bacterium]MCX8098546.1 NAD+ synthase [Casimicrobiaceae bacterium]MDW8311241.1 NAD+ synthase [Burkholderiales bacterium]